MTQKFNKMSRKLKEKIDFPITDTLIKQKNLLKNTECHSSKLPFKFSNLTEFVPKRKNS